MSSRSVSIRHPGYKHLNDLLLTFPACEGPSRSQAYYPTIIAACQIITGMPDEIWLQQPGTDERFHAGADDLISAGTYYLHISSASDQYGPYPIVPNWDNWTFPHDRLPQLWLRMTDDSVVYQPELVKGERCRITNTGLVLEMARIMPEKAQDWFRRNGMSIYGLASGHSGETIIDSTMNIMRLAPHAHRIWDDLDFCIVPRKRKLDGDEQEEVKWTTQAMGHRPELESHWHNKVLLPLTGRAVEYLYARFAWHIFPRLAGFLLAGEPRVLAVVKSDGSSATQEHGAVQCRQFTIAEDSDNGTSPTTRRGTNSVPIETVHKHLVSDHGTRDDNDDDENGNDDDGQDNDDNDDGDDNDDDAIDDDQEPPSPYRDDSASAEIQSDYPMTYTRRRRRSSSPEPNRHWIYEQYEEEFRGRKRTRL